MAGSLMQTVTRVVDRGLKTNSYKLALLRSLVAIVGKSSSAPLRITRRNLAEQFVEKYWRLALLFHVRQATIPDKDPVVMRLIRAEQSRLGFPDEMTVHKYLKTYPADYRRLIDSVASKAFDDVLPRFHTVRNQSVQPVLYKPDGDDIIVEKPAYEFLRANARSVDLLAIAGWVAFTEQYTSAPRLFEKIEGAAARRTQLARYRTFLGSTYGFTCFYCRVRVPQNTPVDHVVPWAFVLEDKVWNLVLACESCNGKKSSAVASMESLERLSDRNELLLAKSSKALPPFISGELTEWRARSLRDHLSLLAEHCRSDGFPEWHAQC